VSGGSITNVADVRSWFQPSPCAVDSSGGVTCAALGTNQNVALMPGVTGKAGIGTSSPSYPLDVNGNVIGVGTTTAYSGFGGSLRIRDDTGTPRWLVGLLGSGGATNFLIRDMTASPAATRLSIDTLGQIYASRSDHPSAAGADYVFWGINYVSGDLSASPASAPEGVNGEAISEGAVTNDPPSGLKLVGLEGAAAVDSTGSTIPDVRGLTANVHYWHAGSSDTNITNVRTIVAQQFDNTSGGTPNGSVANVYGVVAEPQSGGTARNFPIWSQGDILFSNGTANNGQALWSMNSAGTPYKTLQFGGTDAGQDTVAFFPLDDTKGFRFRNNARNADWMALVSGKVGIGTTSPGSALQVGPGTAGAGEGGIIPQINNLQASGTASVGAEVYDGTYNQRAALFVDQNNLTWGLYSSFHNYGMPFTLSLGSVGEVLRVTTDGKVGIGTSSPALQLQLGPHGSMAAGLTASTGSGTTETWTINLTTGNTQQFACGTGGATVTVSITTPLPLKGESVTLIFVQNSSTACTLSYGTPQHIWGGMTSAQVSTLGSANVQQFIVSNNGTDLYAAGPVQSNTGGTP
jgi:hypothetical protein